MPPLLLSSAFQVGYGVEQLAVVWDHMRPLNERPAFLPSLGHIVGMAASLGNAIMGIAFHQAGVRDEGEHIPKEHKTCSWAVFVVELSSIPAIAASIAASIDKAQKAGKWLFQGHAKFNGGDISENSRTFTEPELKADNEFYNFMNIVDKVEVRKLLATITTPVHPTKLSQAKYYKHCTNIKKAYMECDITLSDNLRCLVSALIWDKKSSCRGNSCVSSSKSLHPRSITPIPRRRPP
ncbi:hypothetical protein N0V85_001448 [Neurospora sp. IMI 360204]|nr:hypothetical protein N0V85_001448 [Neurospora sp. IMI 360204]